MNFSTWLSLSPLPPTQTLPCGIDVDAVLDLEPLVAWPRPAPCLHHVAVGVELDHRRRRHAAHRRRRLQRRRGFFRRQRRRTLDDPDVILWRRPRVPRPGRQSSCSAASSGRTDRRDTPAPRWRTRSRPARRRAAAARRRARWLVGRTAARRSRRTSWRRWRGARAQPACCHDGVASERRGGSMSRSRLGCGSRRRWRDQHDTHLLLFFAPSLMSSGERFGERLHALDRRVGHVGGRSGPRD